ncbi:MAG: aldo/keto reductase [Planctomycetota bacterium]|jgi:aryl-alcohol dehydrogenase-like predicted oxidoreductase|nr:aldo/keto reductase [Planctomycetota bacterium]MDP7129006.1 aldo/keto reductase [Planctomycetota bacterium]MDP7248880.1 aldo/keto reductase [Planctomycetota bacterium]
MNYRTFGRTGWEVSEVSLGGAYLKGSNPESEQENANGIVRRAKELGINYIDTAPLYGNSEILLGEALVGLHDDFIIATKAGFDPDPFDYRSGTVLRSIERSLERLRISRLSLVQIHEVNLAGWESIMSEGGALEGLRIAQKQGMCERIGITSRAIPLLARLAETGEFDTVLVYRDYHPGNQLSAEQVIPAAHSRQMGIVIATPLAGCTYTDGPRRQEGLGRMEADERERTEQALKILGPQAGSTVQNCYQYLLADARVSTVCGGPASVTELEEIASASDMGPLAESIVSQLNAL